MRALVLGPTGVVGDSIVRAALAEPRMEQVFAVARRPLKQASPRLSPLLHSNFEDFSPLAVPLSRVDVVLCALGLSWYQAKGEVQYYAITHDYVMACARTAAVANPAMRFCFISGHGASSASSQTWARIKGETENDLSATFGTRLNIFRPGYIVPSHGREVPYWGDAVMRPLMPFRRFMSRWVTDSDEVAAAVMFAALGGPVPSPASNQDIITAAARYTGGAMAHV